MCAGAHARVLANTTLVDLPPLVRHTAHPHALVPRPRRYPVDTGMFVTGGHDNLVKVWDTNRCADEAWSGWAQPTL